MYQTIIVPLDGSARSERALPVAVSFARAAGAALELVRVHSAEETYAQRDPSLAARLRATAHRHVEGIAESCSLGLGRPVAFELLDPPIVDALSDHAARKHAPLIVMATHGRLGVNRAILGSISDGLIRRGSAPVLVLRDSRSRSTTPSWSKGSRPFSGIVVPLDGTSFAESAVPHAVALAKLTNARIHLVRVVTPLLVTSPLGSAVAMLPLPTLTDAELTQNVLANDYLANVVRRAIADGARPGITTDVALSDTPATAIIDACRRHAADLVVMASHARGPSRLVVHSVADLVLKRGTDAMLLIGPVAGSRRAGHERDAATAEQDSERSTAAV